jgi:hypothetical protein
MKFCEPLIKSAEDIYRYWKGSVFTELGFALALTRATFWTVISIYY